MYIVDQLLTLLVAGLVALFVARAGSALAMGSQLLPDQPNNRSSHTRVTSRAGGVAIFSAWFAAMFILGAFSGTLEIAITAFKFALVTFFAFLVGLLDDQWSLKPTWKFVGQIITAVLFVYLLGPLEAAPLPVIGVVELGFFGVVLTIIWIVAFMNIVNFMDGANGIAGGSAAIGCAAFAVIAALTGAYFAAAATVLLALAIFGFLPANMEKGRLFMGDSGSLSISFAIAGIAVYAANATGGAASPMIIPVIFLPFIFDVVWTLSHRIFRKQNILQAHREHLYQLLMRRGFSHVKVSVMYYGAVLLCVAAAIVMLTLAPRDQFIAPVLLCVLGFFAAVQVHRATPRMLAGSTANGEKAGSLDEVDPQPAE